MSFKREVINVRVNERILWVGAQAYPLHNIARAQTLKLGPDREEAVRAYIKSVVLWASLGIGVGLLSGLRRFMIFVVLAVIVVKTIKLLIALSEQAFYALVIETAGNPQAVLVTTEESEVTRLVHQIMDAINNPRAEFQTTVNNYHVGDKILGDKILQFGNRNVGKVTK